ncbi:MAG: tetratricopeptide repeat protein [Nitrospirae bacterium YQR-1]
MPDKTKHFEIITNAAKAHGPVVLTLLVTGFIVYSNIFNVPFFFDDVNINKYTVFKGWNDQRSVVVASFVLNHKLGGNSVWGYHLVNIIIHIVNAVLVYVLLLLVQRTPSFKGGSKRAAPFFASLLFVAHPIAIQAVTLTIQRFTLLSTTLYLMAIILYSAWRITEKPATSFYYILSLCIYLISIRTKETVITLPAVLLICEFCFFKGHITKRILHILPYVAIASIIFFDYTNFGLFRKDSIVTGPLVAQQDSDFVQLNANLPPSQNFENRAQYLFTQMRVIITYMRMLVLPYGLTLIHHFTVSRSFFEFKVLLSFITIAAFACFALYLFYKSRSGKRIFKMETGSVCLISFGIAWFFLTLLPQASIIPIQNWIILEHRVYLPSIGFFAVITAAATEVFKRCHKYLYLSLYLPCFLIVITLGTITYINNSKWRNETSVWEDNVRKEPLHHYVHILLGNVYLSNKRFEDAAKQYRIALNLNPEDPINHNNIGNIYLRNGDVAGAFKEFSEALRLKPDYAEARNNLGNAYIAKKDMDAARVEYENALKIKPDYVEALTNLGSVHLKQGKPDEALKYYEKALKINPDSVETHSNLGACYIYKGVMDKAYEHYKKALELDPEHSKARDYVELLKNLK